MDERVAFQSSDAAFGWDGGVSLVVKGGPSEMCVVDDLHDISHFLIASEAQRLEPEFGLGPDPNRASPARPSIPYEMADLQEVYTCWLQLGLALALGISPHVIRNVALSLNSNIPFEEEWAEVQAYRPEALPDEMWDRVRWKLEAKPTHPR